MRLSTNDLLRLADVAIVAASRAGELISRQVTSELKVETKEGGESLASQVVTQVDIMAQELILSVLKPTFEKYDLALLAEETADDHSRLEKDYFWCIDPIDGTLPFTEGIPGYAVAISLISRAGEPQVGVVYDPVEGNLYHAIKGRGAFKNRAAWQPITSVSDTPLSFICDRSITKSPCYEQLISGLEKWSPHGLHTHLTGGAVMNAIWVLENAPACYFKPPRPKPGSGCFWDYAATACIYHELGLPASDIFGNPLQLNNPETLFMNHSGILYATNLCLATSIIELCAGFSDAK